MSGVPKASQIVRARTICAVINALRNAPKFGIEELCKAASYSRSAARKVAETLIDAGLVVRLSPPLSKPLYQFTSCQATIEAYFTTQQDIISKQRAPYAPPANRIHRHFERTGVHSTSVADGSQVRVRPDDSPIPEWKRDNLIFYSIGGHRGPTSHLYEEAC